MDLMGADVGILSGAFFIWSIIYLCRLIDNAVSGSKKGAEEAKEKMNQYRKKLLKKLGIMSDENR